MQGISFGILVVCGYPFDPHLGEDPKCYGAPTVLPTRVNAGLAMGDDLLKKIGASNLFMVFEEPDNTIARQNEHVTALINSVDLYEPTIGQIRSSTGDIAC